ncbi:hypothetical protein [Nostoc flagelliforme]|uniref:hypothetical protein n=1 Tax=Nostoc flagelliforme TaxID=1306274 RepID=UPI0012FD0235|nr:hypothetical protein [Nostoc flagelliforme]
MIAITMRYEHAKSTNAIAKLTNGFAKSTNGFAKSTNGFAKSTISLCHASVTHRKSLLDKVFPTCVYTVAPFMREK